MESGQIGVSFFADIWDKFNKDKNLVCKGKSLQWKDDPPQNLLENKVENISKNQQQYLYVRLVQFQTIKLQSLEIKKTSFVYKAP